MGDVVVGVDGSAQAGHALQWAVHEAALRHASLELVHVFVVHPYSAMFGGTDRDLARARLDAVVEQQRASLDRVTWSARLVDAHGTAAAALVEAAGDADLVVVGARGAGGFARLALGSTGYRVAAHAPVPVAVVPSPPGDREVDPDVVVGIDGSPHAERALHWALDEAGRRGSAMSVVHGYLLPVDVAHAGVVVDEGALDLARTRAREEATALVDRVLERVEVPPGTKVRRDVVLGAPAGAVLGRADGRLIVVGASGQAAWDRAVFGSVSDQVLHHANGPVVVVP